MLELILQTAVNAAYAASYLALIAVGLVLIFGVMGVINFAHGELYMLGSYAVFFFYVEQGVNFFAAVALGLFLVGLLGLALERGLFRPLRDNPLGGLIVSIGVLLCLQSAVVLGFGVRSRPVHPPVQRAVSLMEGVSIQLARLYVILAAIGLLVALWLFLKFTMTGSAIRAVGQNQEATQLLGMNVPVLYMTAFGLSAALAAMSGILLGSIRFITPIMGSEPLTKALIVAIFGGLGSLMGTVGAAYVIGLLEALSVYFIGLYWTPAVLFVVMIAVLLLRPEGLFTRKGRKA